MDLQYVKKLVRLIEGSSVDSIEIEEEGTKIKISKTGHEQVPHFPHAHVTPLHGEAAAPPQTVQPSPAPPAAPAVKYHEIKSPIVGTFYRSPAPDADVYVEVGQNIQVGTVLCIIEAMKLMNEIESDVAGRIVKVLADNAKPVEYGQTLFLIEPV